MENERANLHDLKLADLREQLREANRVIHSLKESEKEKEKLLEKQKTRDGDASKAVREAVEEEKKKAKRAIAKQDAVIKALDKKLTEEQEIKTENEKIISTLKLQLEETEESYKMQIKTVAEKFEEEKNKWKEEFKKLEDHYVGILADREREMKETVSKMNREREETMNQLTKHQTKSLAALKTNVKTVIIEKDKLISSLNVRLEESNARISTLDLSVKEIMTERQKDLKSYAEARQIDENRFRDELAVKEQYHSEELEGIYERIKGVVMKKDETIANLKAELALAHKKITEIMYSVEMNEHWNTKDPLSEAVGSMGFNTIMSYIEPELLPFISITCSSWFHKIKKRKINLSDIVYHVASSGYIDLLQYVNEFRKLKTFQYYGSLCGASAKNGHLECLKFLHKEGCDWDARVCKNAAEGGFLYCLKYAHENDCQWNSATCIYAAGSGQIECLKYAHENGCEWNEYVTLEAAIIGSLECLKYLHENGCPWDIRVSNTAAKFGHLECLKYAHENGCEWNEQTYRCAEQGGHTECTKYMKENGLEVEKFNLRDLFPYLMPQKMIHQMQLPPMPQEFNNPYFNTNNYC